MSWEELYIRSRNPANNMLQLLYKYLILHHKVSIPTIGVFDIRRTPAAFDFSNQVFVAPSFQVGFTEAVAADDKKLYSFIAREQQVDEAKAAELVSRFTQQVKQQLDDSRKAELAGLGVLSKSLSGELRFEAVTLTNAYFPDVRTGAGQRELQTIKAAEDVQEPNTQLLTIEQEDAEPVAKSTWWIYALVLALIAVAAIGFYYYQNGSFR